MRFVFGTVCGLVVAVIGLVVWYGPPRYDYYDQPIKAGHTYVKRDAENCAWGYAERYAPNTFSFLTYCVPK